MSETRLKLAYFPGCSLESTALEYDESTRAVCDALGIDLIEIPDWNCCGSTAAHSLDPDLARDLPARNLKLACEIGADLMAPCAECYSREKHVLAELSEDESLRNELIGNSDLNIAVRHVLEVLADETVIEKIAQSVERRLGLRVVCYYGCLLTRPPDIADFDDTENPQTMDRLIEAIGCEAVDWSYKTECCGAGLSLPRTDVVLKLVGKLVEMAHDAEADCIAVACPMCHANLDGRQKAAVKRLGIETIPVLYITELVGMALGLDAGKWLKRHLVPVNLALKE